MSAARLVLEPVGRNTAPAAAVAALLVAERDPEALLLIAPSDHVVGDAAALRAAIGSAAAAAAAGALVTFGVQPSGPHTGYGYIRRGAPLAGASADCYEIERFVEKPDAASAQRYVDAGTYYWNSGMFLFGAARYLEALGRRKPAMLEACRAALAEAGSDDDFLRLAKAPFERIEGDSIDYAVMEHAERAAVVPIDVGWSDLGSWRALWELGERDAAGNVVLGDAVVLDARNAYVRSDGPLVAAVGVEDLVIVATADAVLVTRQETAEAVREVVARLKAEGRPEPETHAKVYRPWGSFEGIKAGEGYQVKLLTVNPGAALSLQYHKRRAEHWVVVAGEARVTLGETTQTLKPNQATYVATGVAHRLENPGTVPLQVIEVQSGDYLGEDDIVRLEDRYGRD
jgi:mannose-1-phosphate guanylyltransferase/mannose-6-phosphate isomerase